jgi:hypothetical protein
MHWIYKCQLVFGIANVALLATLPDIILPFVHAVIATVMFSNVVWDYHVKRRAGPLRIKVWNFETRAIEHRCETHGSWFCDRKQAHPAKQVRTNASGGWVVKQWIIP